MNPVKPSLKTILNTSVIVAALGYFVDVYDLLLFQIVRVDSLKSIVPGIDLMSLDQKGSLLISIQMAGLLLGGILWGIIGDKKGRLSVLFGSIATYSIANFLNGFVTTVDQYAILRFIAGVGLAGELGAGITLVTEVMPKEIRGYGTMIVASVGVVGAVFAAFVAGFFKDLGLVYLIGNINYLEGWRVSYFIGGILGLMLLLLRIGVFESGMYSKVKEQHIQKGNFMLLFSNYQIFSKYIKCILIGLPVWYIIGVLITFSSTFAGELGVQGTIVNGTSIMICYSGLVFGDLFSGSLSQYLKSRKKVFFIFFCLSLLFASIYFTLNSPSTTMFYSICFMLGVSVGYWAILVTVAAEQFGTNMRATVATTVPNLVRGSLIPVLFIFNSIKPFFGDMKNVYAASIVGAIVFVIAFIALYFTEETFEKEMDYYEE